MYLGTKSALVGSRHVDAGKVARNVIFSLVAGMTGLHVCLASLPDLVIKFAEGRIGHLQETQHSTVLEALYQQKECTNELWQCHKAGALPDLDDVHCFNICIAVETGCRSCCSDGKCYQPPQSGRRLGSCATCPNEGPPKQCAQPILL
jgi:hypothetical protein